MCEKELMFCIQFLIRDFLIFIILYFFKISRNLKQIPNRNKFREKNAIVFKIDFKSVQINFR